MNGSIENRYKVSNQVLELTIKLPGQYQLKNNTCIFIKYIEWQKYGPPDNMIHCAGICMDFLLWKIKFYVQYEKYL